ncbi:anaphase promoting complex subunit doc1 [Onygenales sp. PD_12]|nr:anaphase promoting complex subunit doc1 [Onygenales sp. PD_12]
MPRHGHGLRRGGQPRSAFPSEDGAFASTPTNETAAGPSNFRTPPGAGQGRNHRAGYAAHNVAIAGDPDVDGAEEDFEGSAEGLDDDDDIDGEGEEEGIDEEEEEEEELEEEEEEEEEEQQTSAPIPPNLREISSLASWTVSTHKPGCGIAALRHPSPTQFWQSDGPQPHTLSLHFFKRVEIVRIRVYLDFELDESYTPTKMIFLAGMGGNDLVEFAVWTGEAPSGWVDIDLAGVGGRHHHQKAGPGRRKSHHRRRRSDPTARPQRDIDDDDDDDDHDLSANDDLPPSASDSDSDPDLDPSTGNVLKAMVLSVRISENHQNGKDTHVRGFQVYARDDRRLARPVRDRDRDRDHHAHSSRKSLRGAGAGAGSADARKLNAETSMELGGGGAEEFNGEGKGEGDGEGDGDGEPFGTTFDEEDWMGEMEIR